MRWNTFSRLLAVAASLAATPQVSSAQSVTYNFANNDGGFTASGGWAHGSTPAAPGGGTAWSISGQPAASSFALESPAAGFTVTTAGPVTGTLMHRFNFGADASGESPIPYAGGVLEYRVGNGAWFVVPQDRFTEAGPFTILPNDNGNPLGDKLAFTSQSSDFDTNTYVRTTFSLDDTSVDAPFGVNSAIHIRFQAGFADPSVFSNPDMNWQLGSLALQDASPVPEPAGVLGLAALSVAGYRSRRAARVTSPASPRMTAS